MSLNCLSSLRTNYIVSQGFGVVRQGEQVEDLFLCLEHVFQCLQGLVGAL
jgi:hypothetical protein